MNLRGKVAVVTGGAQGIGRAICTSLLNAGLKILMCDVDDVSAELFLEDLSEDLKQNIKYQKCDVSSLLEFKAAFETAKSTYGNIDIVINNAGVVNENNWRKMIEINFIGVVYGIQLSFEYMGKNSGGSGGYVINTASNEGLAGFDLAPVYSGTKHAVVGLTRSYGQKYHFDKTGITVNAVCPGPTGTQLFYAFPQLVTDEECAADLISNLQPVSPDEVAKACLKLIQDGKNGALLRVDHEQGTRCVFISRVCSLFNLPGKH